MSAVIVRPSPMPSRLTYADLLAATRLLARRDRGLRDILKRHGPPPLWGRRAGFATLVQIILEQQVSLASGRSAYERLTHRAGEITPDRLLALGPDDIRAAGLTRQKTRYILELATAITEGSVDLKAVGRMNDEAAREALMVVPGIGPWTADIYLLMALRRTDVWPVADLALRHAVQELRGLREPPTDVALDRVARRWRPHRSVAARMLWHSYLSTRGRS